MKIYFIFILFAITANNPIHAQYSIHGKIKDAQSQQALAGASIYFNDLKAAVNSDEQGNYAMKNLKPGNYLIEINLLNYKTTIQQIQMQSDTIIDFLMLVATKELTEIIITGVTRSTELKRSPIIIKSIDKQLLNEGSSTNLIDALKNVPGLSQIITAGFHFKPVIRGLGYNRIISLHNGIRQEGQQWGDEHGIEIDEYSIDRIEIIKGPGSLMYGSDGIAGVLNFISPKALPIGKTKTQIISNYQSNNQLIGYSFSHSGNKNGLQWLGRFSNKWASNYKNVYDGPVYNTGFREINGSLFLGVNKKWGHAHLNMSTYNSSANLAEGERDSLGQFIAIRPDGSEMTVNADDLSGYKIGFPHQAIHHHRISSNNYFILKSGTLHVDLGYQKNLRQEFGDITNPNDIALNFDLNTINYNVRYNLANIKGWETSLGLSGMQQNNQNKGLEFFIPEYNLFDIGGFVFTQKTFNRKWNFAVGIRFDNRWMLGDELILDSIGVPVNSIDSASSIKFNAFNQSYNGLSGSIGLSYQFDQNSTLKLNLSRGFRAPNIAELTSKWQALKAVFRYEYEIWD
ncbi:MAG: TonB-dependent receptor [Bacteroidetes bacterium]|nr:TonB-dependent receptor [Bacteroidota bacterium]